MLEGHMKMTKKYHRSRKAFAVDHEKRSERDHSWKSCFISQEKKALQIFPAQSLLYR